jgi:hypothetical protein
MSRYAPTHNYLGGHHRGYGLLSECGNRVAGMTLKTEMVTFDCSDPAKLASWWAEQFDGKT